MSSGENTTTAEMPKRLLVDVPLDSPNAALNVIISFVTIAQSRGVFTVQESAKLWDCIKFFTGAEPVSLPVSSADKCADECADECADKCADECAEPATEVSATNITLDVIEDASDIAVSPK